MSLTDEQLCNIGLRCYRRDTYCSSTIQTPSPLSAPVSVFQVDCSTWGCSMVYSL